MTAFSEISKCNGFFLKVPTLKGDPKLLTMGPYYYYTMSSQCPLSFQSFTPVRAKACDKWLFMRQSANAAPNYFLTADFKTFQQISDINPQKKYNWLTTELISFKKSDGTIAQGILYKPDDFNQANSYPVIFNYYERSSQNLNVFIRPEFANAAINIPWMVSRGYLVFTPDVNVIQGKVGESIYNSVVKGANVLSTFQGIDSTRMGLAGQSFGGFETQYLVTHSRLFAAAVATSGFCNMVSFYGGVLSKQSIGGLFGQEYSEYGQFRLGITLWQRT